MAHPDQPGGRGCRTFGDADVQAGQPDGVVPPQPDDIAVVIGDADDVEIAVAVEIVNPDAEMALVPPVDLQGGEGAVAPVLPEDHPLRPAMLAGYDVRLAVDVQIATGRASCRDNECTYG